MGLSGEATELILGIVIVIGLIAIVICIIMAVIVGRKLAAGSAVSLQNDSARVQESYAKIVSKRTTVWGMDITRTTYYTTFEIDNAQRLEFKVTGEEYGMLAESDIGSLKYKGTKFVSFDRDMIAQPIVRSA